PLRRKKCGPTRCPNSENRLQNEGSRVQNHAYAKTSRCLRRTRLYDIPAGLAILPVWDTLPQDLKRKARRDDRADITRSGLTRERAGSTMTAKSHFRIACPP